MRAYVVFAASGPIVVLTSHPGVTHPKLLEKLEAKGICKFIACELPVELARERYGGHFDLVVRDLRETDDLRILDYNGHRAFSLFRFSEVGDPIMYEACEEEKPA